MRREITIAVIGGGSAGFLAARQVSSSYPHYRLLHIFDPTIPSIGVGEGTLPGFLPWLESMVRRPVSEVIEVLGATRKFGLAYEGWGTTNREFPHNFWPTGKSYGFHLSAGNLVKLLADGLECERIDKHVDTIVSSPSSARIEFSDGDFAEADFVFDARGFPKTVREEEKLTCIPTNAALVRQVGPVDFNKATRTIARPHGWIFVIPLQSRTSFGYIYNNNVSSQEEVGADFDIFMEEEQHPQVESLSLKFPNFVSDRLFDGSVLKIGNRAGFTEPLEATALSLLERQILIANYWPLSRLSDMRIEERTNPNSIENINLHLRLWAIKFAAFLSWHYSQGSLYATPFWDYAMQCWEDCRQQMKEAGIADEFDAYARANDVMDLRPAFISTTFSSFPVCSFVAMRVGLGA